jgi:hypothetical protein
MFEVTKYEPPQIFVTSRQTGETYKFLVENNDVLAIEGIRLDQQRACQKAIAYLAWFSQTRARIVNCPSPGGASGK